MAIKFISKTQYKKNKKMKWNYCKILKFIWCKKCHPQMKDKKKCQQPRRTETKNIKLQSILCMEMIILY